MKKTLSSILLVLILSSAAFCAAEVKFPAYNGYLNDYAGVIDQDSASKISSWPAS